MSVTFTAASERDHRETVHRTAPRLTHRFLLLLTTAVAVMAIGLSYAGRVRTSAPATGAQVANLNTVTEARAIEVVLAPAFSDGADRRFAATHLMTYLESLRKEGNLVPNVGAIMAATVSADVIAQSASQMYKDRLQRAIERADAQER